MSVLDLIPGLSAADLITAMAALAAGFSVYAVWTALLVRDPMAGRIKNVGLHRDELRQAMLAAQGNRARRRETTVDFMRRVALRLKLLKTQQADAITLRLAQAGFRSKDALVIYLFAKLALPFVLGGVAVILVYVSNLWAMSGMMKLFVAIAAVIAGAYAPEVFVANIRQKRQQAMQKGRRAALVRLAISAGAGLALDPALARGARKPGPACPELAEELSICAVELGFLPDRRQALDNLSTRTALASIQGVVNSLQQTEKYGTPLSLSLRVLSTEFRNDRMMRAEEKAARLPATLTVPLILFILPALFVVLLGPAVISAIDGLGGLK